ncbi:MAG TPA: hypothetical protein VIF62_34085 [Labilithrix sp.]
MGRIVRALVFGASAAAVGAACASFSSRSDSPDVGGAETGADAPPNDESGAPDAPPGTCDAAVSKTCPTDGKCDDFESDTFGDAAPAPWAMLEANNGGTVTTACDDEHPGRVLVSNLPARDAGVASSAAVKMIDLKLPVTVAFSYRTKTDGLTFSPPPKGGFASIADLYCSNNPQRGFGIVFDGRGFSFEFDNNLGDVPMYADDFDWHTIEVTISATSSHVLLDGKEPPGLDAGARAFAGVSPCYLELGALPGGGGTNALEVRFDDLVAH